jgi:hypothetical protein
MSDPSPRRTTEQQERKDWRRCDRHPDINPDQHWACADCMAEARHIMANQSADLTYLETELKTLRAALADRQDAIEQALDVLAPPCGEEGAADAYGILLGFSTALTQPAGECQHEWAALWSTGLSEAECQKCRARRPITANDKAQPAGEGG